MLAGAVYSFFCVAPTFWANYHAIMRECVNWVSVTAFISASLAADNYRIAQRQAINSTLSFCRHAMLVPSIVAPRTVRATIGDRPSLPGGCCIYLEQFAGDITCIAVTTSFPQKTED